MNLTVNQTLTKAVSSLFTSLNRNPGPVSIVERIKEDHYSNLMLTRNDDV